MSFKSYPTQLDVIRIQKENMKTNMVQIISTGIRSDYTRTYIQFYCEEWWYVNGSIEIVCLLSSAYACQRRMLTTTTRGSCMVVRNILKI